MSNKENEVLSYIIDTYDSEPAGVFSYPRKNGMYKNRVEDFLMMRSRLEDNTLVKSIEWEGMLASYLDIPFKWEETVSTESIRDAIKYIATRVSDRHYQFLKTYFDTFTFLNSDHKFSGFPVLIKNAENMPRSEKKILTLDDIKGSVGDKIFPIPEADPYTMDSSLAPEIDEAIMNYERKIGFEYNTMTLRKVIGMNYMAQYQVKAIYNLKRYNYIAACRRSGKSFLAAYIAIRHLFRKNKTILYAVPSERYFFQPMIYFNRLIKNIRDVDRSITISFSENLIQNKETSSVIKMVSARMEQGIRSFDGDGVIIDEADFFPEAEYMNLLTIIEQKFDHDPLAFILSLSTIDPEKAKKNETSWFYRDLIEAELNANEDVFSMRVPILKNEFYSEKARENMIRKYLMKNDEIGLRCELYAEYPPSSKSVGAGFFPIAYKGIDISMPTATQAAKVIEINYGPETQNPTPSHMLFSYDPASNTSGSVSALTPAALYSKKDEPNSKRITLLAPIPIPKSSLFIQVQLPEIIRNIEETHKLLPKAKICFIYDINGIGLPLAESIAMAFNDFKKRNPNVSVDIIPVRYVTTAPTTAHPIYYTEGEVRSSKGHLLNVFQKWAQSNIIDSINSPVIEKAVLPESLANLSSLNDHLSTIFQIIAAANYIEPTISKEAKDEVANEATIQMIRNYFAPWSAQNRLSQSDARSARMNRFLY